jgi:hypothetical protein
VQNLGFRHLDNRLVVAIEGCFGCRVSGLGFARVLGLGFRLLDNAEVVSVEVDVVTRLLALFHQCQACRVCITCARARATEREIPPQAHLHD